MPAFKWEGKDRNGQVKKGTITATDEAAATLRLKQQQITPTLVKKSAGAIEIRIPGTQPKLKPKTLIVFTRQFATMIDAGLPLVQGLDILASQSDDKVMQEVLYEVKSDVESGSTFASALEKHPHIFDELYISLVSAGELGGILDTILERLCSYIEKADALKKRIKGAMTYPIVILVVSVGVVSGLMIFVVPTFAKIFKDIGSNLPAATQVAMDMSDFFVNYWPVIFGVMGGIWFGTKVALKVPKIRYGFDFVVLRLPGVGPLIQKSAVAKFTRTLGTMISSGIPILQALDTVQKTAGNVVIEQAIVNVKQKITEGKSMAEPLLASKVFPSMVVQMIAVGENTGALDSMLSKIADFYDEEVDAAVDGVTAVIEPVVIVVLGGLVAFTMLSMYMPVFSLGGSMG